GDRVAFQGTITSRRLRSTKAGMRRAGTGRQRTIPDRGRSSGRQPSHNPAASGYDTNESARLAVDEKRVVDRVAACRDVITAGVGLCVSMMLPLALLLVPQLIAYGTIQQAASARLYLEPFYDGGASFRHLLELSLFPRGWDLALLIAFIT